MGKLTQQTLQTVVHRELVESVLVQVVPPDGDLDAGALEEVGLLALVLCLVFEHQTLKDQDPLLEGEQERQLPQNCHGADLLCGERRPVFYNRIPLKCYNFFSCFTVT